MDFDDFMYIIPKMKDITTTEDYNGKEFQDVMSPKERLDIDIASVQDAKEAAVLGYIYPNQDDKTCILLTLRADYDGEHSAQVSFPGGKKEAEDETLKDTAKRETMEELGLNYCDILFVFPLSQVYIPTSNFLVTPFIGINSEIPEFKTNEEVAKLIEVSVSELLKDKYVGTEFVNTSYGKKMEVPCFKIDEHIVWGATAMILNEVKELFKLAMQ